VSDELEKNKKPSPFFLAHSQNGVMSVCLSVRPHETNGLIFIQYYI